MDEWQKAVMREAFGESSGSEEEEEEAVTDDEARGGINGDDTPPQRLAPIWEPLVEIRGLWLCRDFLSPYQQCRLLSSLQGWFGEASNNQVMMFGNLPSWATELCNSVREAVVLASKDGDGVWPLPPDILCRRPLFDQLIANVYQPGEGICAHVDLMRFEDGIAIVSLESSCVMHFSSNAEVEESVEEGEEEKGNVGSIPVYLPPGSLVLLSGDARYTWKHEINRRPGFQFWDGKELNQKRRTSITLRKLCPVD